MNSEEDPIMMILGDQTHNPFLPGVFPATQPVCVSLQIVFSGAAIGPVSPYLGSQALPVVFQFYLGADVTGFYLPDDHVPVLIPTLPSPVSASHSLHTASHGLHPAPPTPRTGPAFRQGKFPKCLVSLLYD